MVIVKDRGDEALYDKLDLDYPTSDEDDKDDESEVCVYFIFYTHLFFSPVEHADLKGYLIHSLL